MNIFITGASGYVGKRLIKQLLDKGHTIKALVRKGSENKVPVGCQIVIGNALDASTYANEVNGCDTLVHLVGVSHPSPKKANDFITIDLASAKEAANAAQQAGVKHIVYISVAQSPTKVMAQYQAARKAAEDAFTATALPTTFIRPWYIIGPGHYWPLLFAPVYTVLKVIPSTKQKATDLQLVYLPQILKALLHSVENPASTARIIEIAELRKM